MCLRDPTIQTPSLDWTAQYGGEEGRRAIDSQAGTLIGTSPRDFRGGGGAGLSSSAQLSAALYNIYHGIILYRSLTSQIDPK